jgi:hypothetical protein
VRGAEIVAVFDQFEEFFLNVRGARGREPFAEFVAACHGSPGPPPKLLFAIRSDFLHLVGTEFDGRVPEPLMGDKRYHLRNFDEEHAERVITRSARGAGLPLEAALCRRVARDLAAGESVLPSELQIVGARLQSRRIYTLEDYERAGGTSRPANETGRSASTHAAESSGATGWTGSYPSTVVEVKRRRLSSEDLRSYSPAS